MQGSTGKELTQRGERDTPKTRNTENELKSLPDYGMKETLKHRETPAGHGLSAIRKS
jgi:hypothetical protein